MQRKIFPQTFLNKASPDTYRQRFNQNSNLKNHLPIYNDEKPHICEICNKRYFSKDGLNMHLLALAGEKHYVCKISNKMFSQKNNYLLTHAGEKPHVCDTCK